MVNETWAKGIAAALFCMSAYSIIIAQRAERHSKLVSAFVERQILQESFRLCELKGDEEGRDFNYGKAKNKQIVGIVSILASESNPNGIPAFRLWADHTYCTVFAGGPSLRAEIWGDSE